MKKINLLASLVILNSAVAEEYVLKKSPFEQVLKVEGVATSENAVEIMISPAVWNDYTVEKVLPHGTKVTKGQQIVWIDTEKVDAHIEEQELQRKIDIIALKNAQLELQELMVQTTNDMIIAQRTYDRAVEDYKYFLETEQPLAIEGKKLDGEKSEWYLSYTKEELKQLLKTALHDLSEREKLVIQLYYIEELNVFEIAAVMEISTGRVSQIKKSAISNLRRFISGAQHIG